MTVNITANSTGLDFEAIKSLEVSLGMTLPADYKHFLSQANVATPEPNQFKAGDRLGSLVKLLGVSDQPIEDLESTLDLYRDRIPPNILPIGLAGGGNLICVGIPKGQIFFWDHENETSEPDSPSFENMQSVAWSFTGFLAVLKPFDAEAISLSEHDVESVKLKPGFNEKFKNFLR